MKLIPQNIRYSDGVGWLTRLRWIAISALLVLAYTASNVFGFEVNEFALYGVVIFLVLENLIILHFLSLFRREKLPFTPRSVRNLIRFQIYFDLISLVIIIHFTGGLENPIFIFSVFHMVISSILLSRKDSYLSTTFALLLLWILAILEYQGVLNHNNLWIIADQRIAIAPDWLYPTEILTVFTITSFILVYITNFVVGKLREQEEAYRQVNELLEKKDIIKDEYILRVTHNIKGHIAVILTNLGIIKDKTFGEADPRYSEFVEIGYKRTLKLSSFVNTLLRLTEMRLTDNFEMENFSLLEVATNTVASCKNNADEKLIELNLDIDKSISSISGNPLSIEELLQNLISNAIKYTPEKGIVNVKIKDYKNDVLITVSDSGIGIPASEVQHVFSEFFRASNARKLIRDGSGLGLPLAKYICERHNGEIWVSSDEGIGTRFSVVLPKKQLSNNDPIDV
ncbi:MAG: HAMP domain-containing sensor histidine kinase [Bacteroidota bacterium]